jgi:3-hydroxybutyryl-CoA dehydrogenase
MGCGIAASFARYGYHVSIYEPAEAQRSAIVTALNTSYKLLVEEDCMTAKAARTAIENVCIFEDISLAMKGCDFVIEAIPEKLELKQELFNQLDLICQSDAIFASNTSSLPLANMIKYLTPERKKQVLVSHWYNPALLMPIVELSFFGNMEEKTYARVDRLYKSIGKQTVKVLKDVPGLVANRIQQAIAREVFSIIEQNIAAPEDVDRALKFGPAFRYATTGQLEVADFGGLDIWCTVGDNLLPVMDASKQASPMLRRLVEEGKLGVKTCQGFYSYDPSSISEVRRAFMKRLIHQLKASKAYS